MWSYNNTDYLCHYGILGMKWGHRKAQSSKSDKTSIKSKKKAAKLEKKAARKEKRAKWLQEQRKELERIENAKKVAREKGYLEAETYDAYVKQRGAQIEKGRRASMSWKERMDEDYDRAFGRSNGVEGYDYDNEDF